MTTSAFEVRQFAAGDAITVAAPIRSAERAIARTTWIIATVIYLALAAGTAMPRQPYGDEGELASPAYNLVHRGHLEVTQWERARQSHKAYWMPPIFFLAQAAALTRTDIDRLGRLDLRASGADIGASADASLAHVYAYHHLGVATPHLLITLGDDHGPTWIDQALAKLGKRRRVVARRAPRWLWADCCALWSAGGRWSSPLARRRLIPAC